MHDSPRALSHRLQDDRILIIPSWLTCGKGGVAVFDELQQSVRQIKFLADPSAGHLHIGCTEAGAASFVPAVIAHLSRQYPGIIFRVTTGDAAAFIERHLPQREIDLAIGAMPDAAAARDDIYSEALYEDRYFVMAGARNKWARRRDIALRDLIDEPWILPPAESTMGLRIARAFRSRGLEPPNSRVVSFSIPLCHNLLASGGFLTMHPFRLGSDFGLRLLDVQFPKISRSIVVMTLKCRTLSPLAELFISSARDIAKSLSKPGSARQADPRKS